MYRLKIAFLILLFTGYPGAPLGASETVDSGKERTSPKESCQRNFEIYSCQEAIDKAGPEKRGDYIDCNLPDSKGAVAMSCGKHAIIGTAVGFVSTAIAPILYPTIGAYLLYSGLKKEEECFQDFEYKNKVLKPVRAYYGDHVAESYARLSCIEIERKTRAIVKRVQSEIRRKIIEQEKFQKFVQSKQGSSLNKRNLKLRFPPKKREFTSAEIKFQNTMDDIKVSEKILSDYLQKIHEKYRCSSGQYKAKIACSGISGLAGYKLSKAVTTKKLPSGVAGGLGMATTPKVRWTGYRGPYINTAQFDDFVKNGIYSPLVRNYAMHKGLSNEAAYQKLLYLKDAPDEIQLTLAKMHYLEDGGAPLISSSSKKKIAEKFSKSSEDNGILFSIDPTGLQTTTAHTLKAKELGKVLAVIDKMTKRDIDNALKTNTSSKREKILKRAREVILWLEKNRWLKDVHDFNSPYHISNYSTKNAEARTRSILGIQGEFHSGHLENIVEPILSRERELLFLLKVPPENIIRTEMRDSSGQLLKSFDRGNN